MSESKPRPNKGRYCMLAKRNVKNPKDNLIGFFVTASVNDPFKIATKTFHLIKDHTEIHSTLASIEDTRVSEKETKALEKKAARRAAYLARQREAGAEGEGEGVVLGKEEGESAPVAKPKKLSLQAQLAAELAQVSSHAKEAKEKRILYELKPGVKGAMFVGWPRIAVRKGAETEDVDEDTLEAEREAREATDPGRALEKMTEDGVTGGVVARLYPVQHTSECTEFKAQHWAKRMGRDIRTRALQEREAASPGASGPLSLSFHVQFKASNCGRVKDKKEWIRVIETAVLEDNPGYVAPVVAASEPVEDVEGEEGEKGDAAKETEAEAKPAFCQPPYSSCVTLCVGRERGPVDYVLSVKAIKSTLYMGWCKGFVHNCTEFKMREDNTDKLQRYRESLQPVAAPVTDVTPPESKRQPEETE
ncbi:hypothetical protein KIPB_003584 [Kipferlia bialata]|uniref:Uncharacterized protein n=1 Tax=Kipferlia bialata TaxID=797122 RepID=A0A9K3CU36_9EUKA|nr:hypothetical protein KIPB_003584 [Kipferlia bialata]|eukprot:g3584.t1